MRPKTFPEDLELYNDFFVVIFAKWDNKLSLHMSHLKTPLSETHSKTYFQCEKCKKRIYTKMLEPSTSYL